MSGLIAGLAGAGTAANTNQGFYNQAMNNEINAAGSPAATDFLRLQDAALRPQFANNNEQLLSTLGATGLAGSGAGRSLGGNLAATQSSQLAGAAAPLYQQALNAYSGINAAAPQGDMQAYQDAITQFMNSIGGAAQTAGMFFGLPSGGGGGTPSGGTSGGNTGYYSPGDPNGQSNTSYIP